MADAGLGAPGGAVYSSDSLYVGDGTWDASRNSFLLPNIQGLNFDTMRYNGMGNRFQSLVPYHQLISAHGIIAAITFLGVVPAAILIANFYHQNPRLALRIHISLQILTVILATVIFILGYFAVGPRRSLSNPHHGIGLAIYVLILIQAIGGGLIHKIEKGKIRHYIPIKLMLHQWLGRGIALLALAQIPIGLTLYGSPLSLFVLYALVVTAYLVLYFVLTHQRHKRAAAYDDRGSYVTGTELTNDSGEPAHRGRLGALAGTAAGALGIAALRGKFSDRQSKRPSEGHSRVDSQSYLTENSEKYDDEHHVAREEDHTWRNRFLGAGAGLGAAAAAKKFFGRKKVDRDDGTDSQVSYLPSQRRPIAPSAEHLDRLEQGLPMTDEDRWRRTEARERREAEQMRRNHGQQSDIYSGESVGKYSIDGQGFKPHHSGPGLGTGLAAVAGAVGLGGWLERRRSKKEQERIDAQKLREREEERLYRPHEQQSLYPTDDTPRREGGVRFDPAAVGAATYNQQHPPDIAPVPPPPQAQYGSGGYAPVQFQQNNADPFVSGPTQANTVQHGPPRASNPYGLQTAQQTSTTSAPQGILPPPQSRFGSGPLPMPIPLPIPMRDGGHDMPPPPPPVHRDSSASNSPYGSPDRRGRMPHDSNVDPSRSNLNAAPSTLPPPLPVASPTQNRGSADPYSDNSMQSPAISVKVKTHNDGRHVTLRRLNEEEAAVEREARRLGRPSRRREGDSFGSPATMQSPLSQQRHGAGTSGLGQQQPSELQLPGPQQQQPPQQVSEVGGIGSSPATATTGQGYETSEGRHDTARRRRRAERSRAERGTHVRPGTGDGPTALQGQRVEFE